MVEATMVDTTDVDSVLQRVRLECYRDNLPGALALLETAGAVSPGPCYGAEAARIRGWLAHLRTREAYARAYERHQRGTGPRVGLKWLEREFRTLTGRRTRKMVARCATHLEFRRLEREVRDVDAARVLDAGCGEGRVALTLGIRHPGIRVEGLDVSPTSIGLARRLNRFPNVAFHEGLIEEAERLFPRDAFDLAYSFAVLEHVRDVDEVVEALLKLLRPGGRFCFVVPMIELEAAGPLPDFAPRDAACHVRVFTGHDLRRRFGGYPGFALTRLAGEWPAARYPAALRPLEYGAYFVAFSKP